MEKNFAESLDRERKRILSFSENPEEKDYEEMYIDWVYKNDRLDPFDEGVLKAETDTNLDFSLKIKFEIHRKFSQGSTIAELSQ